MLLQNKVFNLFNTPHYFLVRNKVFNLFDADHKRRFSEKLVNYIISILILLNVISIILDSVSWIQCNYGKYLEGFEHFVVFVFSIEYMIRLWTIVENEKYSGKYGRLKYIFSPMALIDIISILPYYLDVVFNFSFIRIIRLIRLIRVFKLERYSKGLRKIIHILREKKDELTTTFCISLFIIIISACFIYLAEKDAQPDKFSSIPESMYWSVVTLTTIGYGDVYPITVIGRLFTCVIALVGIALIAFPTAIITSGFFEDAQMKIHVKFKNEISRKIISRKS
jgi:voltage-gated potassium channel